MFTFDSTFVYTVIKGITYINGQKRCMAYYICDIYYLLTLSPASQSACSQKK